MHFWPILVSSVLYFLCVRKLKNRVAAQAARDRKKMYVDELEEIVAQLRTENDVLREENRALRQEKSCPGCSQITTASTGGDHSSSASVKPEPTSKSAALSPLQKDRIQGLLALLMISCWMNSLETQWRLANNCN